MKDFDLSSLNELELSDLGNLPVVVKVVLVLLLVAGVGVAGFFLQTFVGRYLHVRDGTLRTGG